MAKKAVATFKKGDGRTYSKVIKMVKSPKTGVSRIGKEFLDAITLLIDCKRDNSAVLDTSNLMVLNCLSARSVEGTAGTTAYF